MIPRALGSLLSRLTVPSNPDGWFLAPSRPSSLQSGQLRRSLRTSVAEGMVAEVFTACSAGAALTAWALYLHLGPFWIATLTGLPFLGQIVQLPAAWLTASRGYRKVALTSVFASRTAYLLLALLPFLPLGGVGQHRVLLFVAASSALLGVVANNAWVAWMADVVPQRVRGRYFGRRTALCALAGTGASLAAGAALDVAHRFGIIGPTLSALALMAGLAGLGTTILMSRQHTPLLVSRRLEVGAIFRPYRDPSVRSLLAYQALWNASTGLAGAFYAVHMLQNLKLGFLLVAAYSGGINLVRVLAAPFWGRALDRVGGKPVLIACSVGLTPLPLLWLLPAALRLPMLGIDVFVYGTLWAGHSLALFSLPLTLTPREGRPYYLAALAMTGGLAFALASAVGGALADFLPDTLAWGDAHFFKYQALFVGSSVLRVGTVLLARRVREPRARSTDELLRLVRTSVGRLGAGRLGVSFARR